MRVRATASSEEMINNFESSNLQLLPYQRQCSSVPTLLTDGMTHTKS